MENGVAIWLGVLGTLSTMFFAVGMFLLKLLFGKIDGLASEFKAHQLKEGLHTSTAEKVGWTSHSKGLQND